MRACAHTHTHTHTHTHQKHHQTYHHSTSYTTSTLPGKLLLICLLWTPHLAVLSAVLVSDHHLYSLLIPHTLIRNIIRHTITLLAILLALYLVSYYSYVCCGHLTSL